MNTTHLFVELIVIGGGALLFLVILACAVFGTGWLPAIAALDLDLAHLALLVPLIYLLGIIADRFADWALDGLFSDTHRSKHFSEKPEYFKARRFLIHESEPFFTALEYARSRLRICRGWALMTFLSIFPWIALSWRELLAPAWGTDRLNQAWLISLMGLGFLGVLTWGSFYSWKRMDLKGYEKIRRQADWLWRYRMGKGDALPPPWADIEGQGPGLLEAQREAQRRGMARAIDEEPGPSPLEVPALDLAAQASVHLVGLVRVVKVLLHRLLGRGREDGSTTRP